MNENYILGKKIARVFNKKYGIITYSGTLAIELALSSLELKKCSKVLVLSEVCYSIVNTILKLGLKPVIVSSKNKFYLTDDDIDIVLKKQKIDCILLVHQYGIINKIDLAKYKKNGIKIIEDVAQVWDIRKKDYKIGENSDIVVTSFGKTKPLSYGIGGGLFFNDKSIFDIVDFADNKSREKMRILSSYAFPTSELINYNKLKRLANKIVKEQRNSAKKYYNLINGNNVIHCLNYDESNVWHRFPIWVKDKKIYDSIVNELKNTSFKYQLPHEIKLIDLERNKDCIKYNEQNGELYTIFLRTRNVNIKNQIKILKKIVDSVV